MTASKLGGKPSYNIDTKAAQASLSYREIEALGREWAGRTLPRSFILKACLGEIPFESLVIRPWGKKLFNQMPCWDKTKCSDFLLFLAHVTQEAPGLVRSEPVVLEKILAQKERWIRKIEEWRPRAKRFNSGFLRDLICHLFVPLKKGTRQYYDLPDQVWHYWTFRSSWQEPLDLEREVFFHLAGGGNLLQLETLSVELTKKQAHSVMSEGHYPFRMSVFLASLGEPAQGCESLHRALAARFYDQYAIRNLISLEKDAEKCREKRKRFAFWQTVMHFFRDHPELGPEYVGEVCDYIEAIRFKPAVLRDEQGRPVENVERRAEQPDFSLKGRTPNSLMRRVRDWHEELGRQADHRKTVFKGSFLPSFRMADANRPGCFWRIRELLSSQELQIESKLQKHCVYSYADKCERGESFIFTLENYDPGREAGWEGSQYFISNWGKHVTIELNSHHVVVQVRGRYNRGATAEEKEVIESWKSYFKLSPRPTLPPDLRCAA